MSTDGLSVFRCVLLAAGLASCSSIASSAPARVATPAKPTAATPMPVHSDLVKPVPMAGGLSGGLDARSAALVFVKAQAGEGWQALCQRATGERTRWKELAAVNADTAPRAGAWYRIPPGLWPSGTGQQLLRSLFPKDAPSPEGGWRHVVTDGSAFGKTESPWALAVLFTGEGKKHVELVKSGRPLRRGDAVVVPAGLLLPQLRASPASPAASSSGSASVTQGERALEGVPDTSVERALAPASEGTLPASADSVSPVGSSSGTPSDSALPAGSTSGSVTVAQGERALEGVPDTSVERALAPLSEGTLPASAESASPAESSSGSPSESASPAESSDDEPGDENVPPPDATAPAPPRADSFRVDAGSTSDDGLLRYGQDADGPVGVYRIQKGETLYTDVVMRFTGLLGGRDVNDAAQRLARRSGIEDVTAIRVGQAVRIPFSDLDAAHLPARHPRRIAAEQALAASERLARVETRHDLEGVHVLLDVGHGGSDPGAGDARAWEDDFAYDIACRVMSTLRDRTHAVVHPLVKDTSSGFAPQSRLSRDTDEVLLATPPFRLDGGKPTAVAVNLRWLLANDLRRKLLLEGVADDRIVFISIHADSLHPAARGAMAYFPAAALRPDRTDVPQGPAYQGHAEARTANAFRMGRASLQRAEGLSRRLGTALMDEVGRSGVLVHGFSPVRGEVVRGRAWVPAVLRHNRVGASVLVEACNLSNGDDATNLRDPAWRQQMAEALAAGIARYFAPASVPASKREKRK